MVSLMLHSRSAVLQITTDSSKRGHDKKLIKSYCHTDSRVHTVFLLCRRYQSLEQLDTGTLKLQDWTLQDWTLTDDFAGVDTAGLDIDGLDNGGLDIAGLDIVGLDIDGLDNDGLTCGYWVGNRTEIAKCHYLRRF